MQYVQFGNTGLTVSRLGFGGIPIQRIDQPGTRALLDAARRAGINYIDTARGYTVSESWIGQSLEELGARDDFILATKCRALTASEMEAELQTSLANLRTRYIDLYQFHNPSLADLETILSPLTWGEHLRREGFKIRSQSEDLPFIKGCFYSWD